MPTQDELRPHNTDVQVQRERIAGLGEKSKAYRVLNEIKGDDMPKKQIDFKITKADFLGFSEAFSKAEYSKSFQALSSTEKNIVLNVDLILREYGVNTNQMHPNDHWSFDFAAQTFSFRGEDGKSVRGNLRSPKKEDVQRKTEAALGELHTSATAREDVNDVAPVNPTVLDVATEADGGSLTETLAASYRRDLGSLKARQEFLKSDSDTVAGINKYLGNNKGQLLKADGTGYRGTAEQNRAWMMYIRYDLMHIKDTQEEKDREKVKGEFERNFPAAFNKGLNEQFGGDAAQYVKMDFAVTNMTFEPGTDPRLGGWHVQVSYTMTFLDHGHPSGDSAIHDAQARTFLGGPTNIAEDAPKLITDDILKAKKDSVTGFLQTAKERAQEKESSERFYRHEGPEREYGIDERIDISHKMEVYFDDIEDHMPIHFQPEVKIFWGKEGKGKDKVRYVEVQWSEIYGERVSGEEFNRKTLRAEIPMKSLSTWEGQWPALRDAFVKKLEDLKKNPTKGK